MLLFFFLLHLYNYDREVSSQVHVRLFIHEAVWCETDSSGLTDASYMMHSVTNEVSHILKKSVKLLKHWTFFLITFGSAFVNKPSAEVLLAINVEHVSPNIVHTNPFPPKNILEKELKRFSLNHSDKLFLYLWCLESLDVLSKGQVGRSKEADPKPDSSRKNISQEKQVCLFVFVCFFYLFTGDLTTGAGGQTRVTGEEFTEKCFPYFVLQSWEAGERETSR